LKDQDAAGLQTTFTFVHSSSRPRRISATTIGTSSEQFQLESAGARRVTRHVDKRGIATEFGFSADHLLSRTEAAGTAQERETTYSYLSPEDDLIDPDGRFAFVIPAIPAIGKGILGLGAAVAAAWGWCAAKKDAECEKEI
jgi:hypothetical protein